jgi:hypothetical protein
VQEAGHPQEIERTEEEGPEGACEFCEIGENCDFTGTRQSLAEFEVALRILDSSEIQVSALTGS